MNKEKGLNFPWTFSISFKCKSVLNASLLELFCDMRLKMPLN